MQKGLKDLHVVGIDFRVRLRVETGKGLNSRLSDTQQPAGGTSKSELKALRRQIGKKD